MSQKQLSDSQMAMWKSVIALIHADGVAHEAEDQFLTERFDLLKITEDQKNELLVSLKTPGSVDRHFQDITEPKDRSQFIYFARLLFWSDGDFSQQEQTILKHLQEKVLGKADLETTKQQLGKIEDEVNTWIQEQKDKHPLHLRILNTLIFWTDLEEFD